MALYVRARAFLRHGLGLFLFSCLSGLCGLCYAVFISDPALCSASKGLGASNGLVLGLSILAGSMIVSLTLLILGQALSRHHA